MSRNKLFHLLSASTLIVLALSTLFTVPALADSGSTPPTAPSSGGRSSNKGSPSNPLSQVPAGTKVVVLDSSGNKLALGSQAALNIVTSGDPVWCPLTVATPNNSGLSGCSLPQTTLANLIADIGTPGYEPTHANSAIWISQGCDNSCASGAAILINGGSSTFSPYASYSLTIKGGWNGTYGSGSAITGTSYVTAPLEIVNWHNAVTISHLEVEDTSSGHGLYVVTSGNISLMYFNAYNNYADGAYLSSNGAVTLSNSQFNYNNQHSGVYGLEVYAGGAITLSRVESDYNYYAGGANLDNCFWSGSICSNSAHSPITVTSSDFSGNTSWSDQGLNADSNGAISLTNVTANNNTGTISGAVLNNCNYNGVQCFTNGQTVTLSSANTFDWNGGEGLSVSSGGAITSGPLDANDNTSYGSSLDNNHSTSVLPVTLTGTSSFSDNGGYGLAVSSRGAITVNNLTADFNSAGSGVDLTNDYNTATSSPISVTGINWFNSDHLDGLFVNSYGAITLNNINASNDGLATAFEGLYAQNIGVTIPKSITLNGVNTLNRNGGYGAVIESDGSITLNNVTADCNGFSGGDCKTGGTGSSGIYTDNSYLGSTRPQAVNLLGTNEISFNDADNLDVESYGTVTINNLTANDSVTGYGANLYDLSVPTGAVHLTGLNTFDGNHSWGLYAESTSTISISNLNANVDGNSSSDYGAYLASVGSVTLSGANNFDNNKGTGLYASTPASITISNLTADTNGGSSTNYGAILDSAGNVSLTGTNTFDLNYGYGLYVSTAGAISASNLNAIGSVLNSHNTGVELVSAKTINLTGSNVFNSYSGYGLEVTASGNVTASNVTADFNGYGGNDGASFSSAGSVTLTGTNTFNGDENLGLNIIAGGTIMTSNVTANGTVAGPGAVFNNVNGPHHHNAITMTGTNTFNYNAGDGLDLKSDGAITTNNITASYNTDYGGGEGASFDNCDYSSGSCHGTGNISMTGTNVFLDNATLSLNDGLDLYTNGNVSVTHITADNNDQNGMLVQNHGGTVTVSCGSFMGNGWSSLIGYAIDEDTTYAVPSHTYLNGVDAAGNSYSLLSGVDNVVYGTCTLP